jgi:hypothetical protein
MKAFKASARPRRNKFGAIPTVVDGRRFDSRREAARYAELRILERAGQISGLECQPSFPLVVGTVKIGTYRADFRYRDAAGSEITEDVKGVRTAVYRLKAKLMLAIYGIAIREIE